MSKKKKKRIFISGMRAALRSYESATEKLSVQIRFAKAFDIDIFLTSDYTYDGWMSLLSSKREQTTQINPVDPDFLYIPHHGSFDIPIPSYAVEQKFTLQDELDYVLSEAFSALDNFKKSKDPHALLHFKSLMAFYNDLLCRSRKKFARIIGRLRGILRKNYFTDLRALLRARTRMISRNIDDEHLKVINSALLKELINYFTISSNGHQNNKTNNSESGIIFT